MTTFSTPGSSGEFLAYPNEQVVGIFANWTHARHAIAEINDAGFAADKVGVLHGPEGARRLDASGERHGLLAQISRFFQKFADLDDQHTRRHEQELLAGHILVQVHVGDDEAAKTRVCQILRKHGGYFINYYGQWAVENLVP